jgi:lysophospholipase L1-like esterase
MSPLFAALAAAVPPPACASEICNFEALRPLTERLDRGGESVHILQLGDSHTAGEAITGPLRRHLQLRFGNGGRGVLPPGRPYRGFLTFGVTASQSGGWTLSSILGRPRDGIRPVGLSGYTLTSTTPGSSIGIASDDEENRFDRIIVCALKEPGAGTVRIGIGATRQLWALASPRREPACRSFYSGGPAAAASVTAEDARPVSITSLATERRAGGVRLSNLGVSGSSLVHQARQHDAVVRAELEAYQPALIVLAFGTNEGFAPDFDAAVYESQLRAGIARIRRLARRAVPILLIGAPDAATRSLAVAANGDLPVTVCAPGVFVPSALASVRERQRRVAADLGLAFWDPHAAMGGSCASLDWRALGWMRQDLVHFTRAGGERLARALAAAWSRGEGR